MFNFGLHDLPKTTPSLLAQYAQPRAHTPRPVHTRARIPHPAAQPPPCPHGVHPRRCCYRAFPRQPWCAARLTASRTPAAMHGVVLLPAQHERYTSEVENITKILLASKRAVKQQASVGGLLDFASFPARVHTCTPHARRSKRNHIVRHSKMSDGVFQASGAKHVVYALTTPFQADALPDCGP